MPLDSPYDVLVPKIRAEIGDQDVTDYEFSDEDIITGINAAVDDKIYNDLGETYLVTDDLLDPTILNDKQYVVATVLATAMRFINLRLQIAASQDISIKQGAKSINVDTLVKALKSSFDDMQRRYYDVLMRGFGGIVQIPVTLSDSDTYLTDSDI